LSSDTDPKDALGVAIERYQASVDDFDRETARRLGVNETDLRCLEILIQEVDEITPRELADRLNLTTGSVTTMIDRLSRMDYVVREVHPRDRRKLFIRATPEVIERARELIGPLVAEGNDRLLGSYSTAELALVTEFLTRASELQQRHTERLREMD
jgi:DNA-binding MarR family transcriptional regulator